ncbi:MAG: prolyl oligopeptidase family serine peptidase [Rhodospirillales bacterium]|nr:prolyl oligopeptidase family serine peptidase [Rhodospirillales bacterium]
MLPADLQARAARFLPQAVRAGLYNPQLRPHWIGQTDRFWYRHEAPDGVTFTLVDAETGATRPAFDHARLARALAAHGIAAEPHALPLEDLDIAADASLAFHIGPRGFTDAGDVLRETARPPDRPGETISPDGRLAAFCRGNDLWLRARENGLERQLTFDGAPHHAYGKSPDMNLTTVSLARRGITLPAVALWSPDSRRLLTSHLDERALADWPLVQHVPQDGSARPVLHMLKVANSGDANLPMERLVVIDVQSGVITPARGAPLLTGVMTCIEQGEAWWSADGSRVFFLDRDRLSRLLNLSELDVATGTVRHVLSETADTFIDTNLSVAGLPNIRVLEASDEVIWFSQRDGWAHLYLHDLQTGALKGRITGGEWMVRDIAHVDPANRQVEFLAAGIDPAASPYHRELCRINFDGSGLTRLTQGGGETLLAMPVRRAARDHIRPAPEIGAWRAPSGRFFVHTNAALDRLPVSSLRRADGSLVRVLAQASLAPGLARDWRWPTPFRATAADGHTSLYGAFWLPTDFDPARSYPVIDYIYPGPQRGITPAASLSDDPGELFRTSIPQVFAELGFVVVNIDGRGTPLRAKIFHDASYRRLDDPGTLGDHIAVLRELARRHEFIDLARVGMMGHSAGGYATVRALLDHPDFFHAGVASSGNHDQRGYSFAWSEKFQGPFIRHPDGTTSFDAAANPPRADRLSGRLLLATGEMDDNVHPALTLQLAAALIAADKDFDLLVLPNDDHTTVWSNPYFLRRAMAFMATHLRAGSG